MGLSFSYPPKSVTPPPVVDRDVNTIMRTSNIRASVREPKQPLPADPNELERRFTQVLMSMDLPPDKAKLLRQYDDEKKWDIICDQERVQAKDPPSFYLSKLRTYLDPKASRSARKRKMVGESTSTQVLRDLEISLRTNHIEWVREFLDDRHLGLDSLVDYLGFRLEMMRTEATGDSSDDNESADRVGTMSRQSYAGGTLGRAGTLRGSPSSKRRTRHIARLNMGDTGDDIHVCIMCLRAIMNNKYGFNMVISHPTAIDNIALSLAHRSLRTKALVLELLAAICLVKGGHEIILGAFDRFKTVANEGRRFQTLMGYFMHHETFHIEFMVACTQFVNIVVHSVEDMNYRVHLQHEFSRLGLDAYLERLRCTESDELQVQISAYLDNVFDVAALMEDSETKTAALERAAELEDELGHAHDRLSELERESLSKLAELEAELATLRAERDRLHAASHAHLEEVATLRRAVETHRDSLRLSQLQADSVNIECPPASPAASVAPPPPPPAPPAPAPPPPPPGRMMGGPPPPPPPPGMMAAPADAMTIKRKVQTKYKLPTLNWVVLKPNQVRGTVFSDLDDERLHSVIDFADFEERFKLSASPVAAGDTETDGGALGAFPSKRFKKPDTVSLLEHTRLRNIAISRRKLEMPVEQVIAAINALDLKQLSLENVELVQRMVPTDQETKLYKEYVASKKAVTQLTEEDRFLLALGKVERITAKLQVMSYAGGFHESVRLIAPQVAAVVAASTSVQASLKLRRVLEVVLAFGNYLNSGKRGPAYGFRLQSLDTLLETKSSDRRSCLLHYVVATLRQKMPELLNFHTELQQVEKAALVSLENVVADVGDLERGMETVRKEHEHRRCDAALRDFLAPAEEALRRLRHDARAAADAFKRCAEYFGEPTVGGDAAAFFGLIVRFVRAFKAADLENEQRRRLELAALEAANRTDGDVVKRNRLNQKKQQEAVINELKSKTRLVQEKQLLHQDDVYNGALEDILLGLKSEPYRRADAVRRSQRRRIDNHRLSRTADELEL